jgi:hypothetical protein
MASLSDHDGRGEAARAASISASAALLSAGSISACCRLVTITEPPWYSRNSLGAELSGVGGAGLGGKFREEGTNVLAVAGGLYEDPGVSARVAYAVTGDITDRTASGAAP